MISKLKAACGNVHVWVFVLNLLCTGFFVGIAWGTLSTQVSNLEHELEKFAALQASWNLEEHRTDDGHRDRINQIEDRMFQVLTALPKR